MGQLDGKVAIIAGAARGQGRSHALLLAMEGADLVVSDICQDVEGIRYPMARKEQLDSLVDEIRRIGRRAIGLVCDVRDEGQVKAVVDACVEEFGKVDILCNNAGICPMGMIHEMPLEEMHAVIDICLKGVWLCSKHVIPHMMRQKSGSIISTGSISSLRGYAQFTHYVAAKHGVLGITRALAVELAPYNIRVNCVCPGHVDTNMTDGIALYAGMVRDDFIRWVTKSDLFPRMQYPIDISKAYLWLASEDSRNVTGIVIPVDCGFMQKSI